MGKLFYKPENALAADFIPFFKEGGFRLFYLHDWRDSAKYGEGIPWYQISTNDFINFQEHGEMLPTGSADEQDLFVFTGSVIEARGLFHIFYTGHNYHLKEKGKPEQAVMHAVSSDLLVWEKIPEDTFYAPQDNYEPHDWRDPFVFWNEEEGEYWMLLAARLKTGPSRRRGCTALCSSGDLKTWTLRDPFWSPGLYYTHECPDLFKMGEWWYLVFSEFSERNTTHYRMSKSLKGPWTAPAEDCFDNRAFYAAKTCSDGHKRYLIGWNPTRENEKDYHTWLWGGQLVVHEIFQQEDGTLAVKVPESIVRAFDTELEAPLKPQTGGWSTDDGCYSADAGGSFAFATAGQMPDCCCITADIRFEGPTKGFGLMLRVGGDMDSAYYIRLEPGRKRLVLDSWPRSGDCTHMVELERPVELREGTNYKISAFIEDSICEVYFDEKVVLSARLYNHKSGQWGIFVQEGRASFRNIALHEMK